MAVITNKGKQPKNIAKSDVVEDRQIEGELLVIW